MGVAETAKPRNCAIQILARKRFPPNILARLDLGVGNHLVKKIMGTSLFCRKLSSFKPKGLTNVRSRNIAKLRTFLISLGLALPVWVAVYLAISAGWSLPEIPPQILGWLWVVLVFPVAEELAFRGFLMGLLGKLLPKRGFKFVTLNNFMTSLLFSIAHLLTRSLTLGLLVFVPSLWLGWVREKTSSIFLCAAIHVSWNLGFFVAATLA